MRPKQRKAERLCAIEISDELLYNIECWAIGGETIQAILFSGCIKHQHGVAVTTRWEPKVRLKESAADKDSLPTAGFVAYAYPLLTFPNMAIIWSKFDVLQMKDPGI